MVHRMPSVLKANSREVPYVPCSRARSVLVLVLVLSYCFFFFNSNNRNI